MSLTCACGRPIHDSAPICTDCTNKLGNDLRSVANLWAQLELTITRRDLLGESSSVSDGTHIEFNTSASEASQALVNTITTWARVVTDETRQQPPARVVDGPLAGSARERAMLMQPYPVRLLEWMVGIIGRVRLMESAPEMVDEFGYAQSLIERTVDRPPSRQYVGPCDVCKADMYVRPDAHEVKCKPCELIYPVGERRAWLLDQAMEHQGTAVDVARAVTSLGTPVTPERIRKWAQRDKLAARGSVGNRPTYRVGDVIDLALAAPAHDTPRRVVAV